MKNNGSPVPVFETDEHNLYFLATIKIHEAFIDERAYLASIGKELDEIGTEGEVTPQVPPKYPPSTPQLPPSYPLVPSKLQQLIDCMGEDFRSLDEIMGAFGYKDKKSFRENYITPALAEGIIERQMLKQRNYKRRSCKKAKTLKEVEDRDAQFKKIKSITHECEMLDIPVLSMDTKKKEMIGNFKRDGKAYCLSAPETYDHDFNNFARGMIAPHALYDRRYNIGYMTIGISHDTSEFVCDNIERIWERQLQHIYTNTDTICLLCDGGGVLIISSSKALWILLKESR